LTSTQDAASFWLMIFLCGMFILEPILHCVQNSDFHIFSTRCPEGRRVVWAYSMFSSAAMLMYYSLVIDLSVFSTRVSAFVLVCSRVLSEVLQFLFGLCFLALAFAAAVRCLEQFNQDFDGIPQSFLELIKITLGMFRGAHWEALSDWPALMILVFAYVLTSIVFLLNLLIAQLNCLYHTTYQDMVGYARLQRGKIVIDATAQVSAKRWQAFVSGLMLDDRVEFGEGDIGLPGGIQVLEPASANTTVVDMIKRYGGSTSPSAQWPEEEKADEEDRFDKMEKLLAKAMKRVSTASRRYNMQSSGVSSSGNGFSASGDPGDFPTGGASYSEGSM